MRSEEHKPDGVNLGRGKCFGGGVWPDGLELRGTYTVVPERAHQRTHHTSGGCDVRRSKAEGLMPTVPCNTESKVDGWEAVGRL